MRELKDAAGSQPGEKNIGMLDCRHHGSTEHSFFMLGGKRLGVNCLKCAAEREQERIEGEEAARAMAESHRKHREQQEAVRREQAIQFCGLGKRFLECSFDQYEADGDPQKKALDTVMRFATNFQTVAEKGANMILLGNTGTGKTHLAGVALMTVIRSGYSGRYFTVPNLIRHIRESWSRDSKASEREVLAELIGYDLLVIDEVGVQYGTDAEKVSLFEVINGRYEQMRPTVLISNLSRRKDATNAPSIEDAMGDRIIDRLRHNGVCIAFNWGSKR